MENEKLGQGIHIYADTSNELVKQSFKDKIERAHANLLALAQSLEELEKAAANHTDKKELDKN